MNELRTIMRINEDGSKTKVRLSEMSAPVGAVPVTFSDVDTEIADGKAYVFRPENPDNKFIKLDLNAILA